MEQRTAEWFEARIGRITASMSGAILGNSPNMSRDDAMRRMVRDWHGAESEFAKNIATEYALNSIAGALQEYTMETGHSVEKDDGATRDDWASADVSGLVSIFGGVLVVCPFNLRDAEHPITFRHIEDMARYVDRIQLWLWVTNRAWCDLYQWCPRGTSIERVTPDAAWRRKNLPKLKAFWDEYMEERQQDNAQKHLEPKRAIIDTPEAHRIMAEYDQLCEALDNATQRKKDLIADMVRIAGDKNAVFAGRNLTLTKRAGAISYAKALAELAPGADLEKWRGRPSESWGVK